jgi:DNA-binding NarL/FixJ family response regulator
MSGDAVSESTTVVLASNNILFRDCLCKAIVTETEMVVRCATGVAPGLADIITKILPAIVIIDLDEVTSAEMAMLAALSQNAPQARLVLLGRSDEPNFIRDLIRIGVCCYITTDVRQEDFLLALRIVDTNHQSALMILSRNNQPSREGPPRTALLSVREQQILELVAEALTNSQIAHKLGITEKTVKRHLSNIFGKLNAVSRLDAVNKASPRAS